MASPHRSSADVASQGPAHERYSTFYEGVFDTLEAGPEISSIYGHDVELSHYDDNRSRTQVNDSKESFGKPEKSSSLIDWDGPDDPGNPQNWALRKKIWTMFVLAFCTLMVAFSSSILSSGIQALVEEYHVSTTVAILNVSLYVVGFVAGPWIWASASEYLGRWNPFVIGYLGFLCFTTGVACAQNFYTVLICRFMQGAWGVATICVVPGMIVDMWSARLRPLMVLGWSITIILGPTLGPVIGSFTVKNPDLGWRWTMWFSLIPSAVFFVFFVLTVEETWGPMILQRRAAKLRVATQDWAIHSLRDESQPDPKTLLRVYGLKPFMMIIQEPILAIMTAYMCFIYGMIYLTFEAFPYAFGVVRGWKDGVSSLPFLGLLVGYIISGFIAGFIYLKLVDAKVQKGQQTVPEDQLPAMILGTGLMIIGFFWFAWTSSPNVSWVAQVMSAPFIGCGSTLVYIPGITYLIECYTVNANSALAANTILRSAVAAGFPLFSGPMYETLGVAWATSILGFLCVAFAPGPIILYYYGKQIRSWSKYTSTTH